MNAQEKTHSELDRLLQNLELEPSFAKYAAVSNYLEKNNAQDLALPPLKIAVLRNFTLDPVFPVLRGEAAAAGFYPDLYVGGFDAIAPDVLDANSPFYAFGADFVIMGLWLEGLAPRFANRFLDIPTADVEGEIQQIIRQIGDFISAIRSHTRAPVLINNFPLPAYPTLGILDSQGKGYQVHATIALNHGLLNLARSQKDVYVVDWMALFARIGSDQAIDERYWHIGRMPLGRSALVPLGREYGKFIAALRGKTRKCLVLDCDNTLWGGIIGEDGIAGIQIGKTHPGSGYLAFQEEILNLHDRGVILALCSKNDEQDVLDVLHDHPEMILREEHFATWQVNWDDKVTNLKRIAKALNIGLNSLVFVDDSGFECELVRQHLPQVATLRLPAEPTAFKARLSERGFFDSLTYTNEDREKNQMYRDEAQRQKVYEKATSLEDYLKNLDIVVRIGMDETVDVARISQLTQKTNQFNLTTRRYGEGEITSFIEDPLVRVFSLRLRDKISDLGLIGTAIMKLTGEQAEIDTFLLSCRAIGRGAEEALLHTLLQEAEAAGCKRITAEYLITKKNGQVADFYEKNGFCLLERHEQGTRWEFTLGKSVKEFPSWIVVEKSA